MVCMAGKVVPSQGPIHYLPGNHSEKRTRQTGPVFGHCAFVMRIRKTTHATIGLHNVRGNRFAGAHSLAHSPRESAADLHRSLLSPYQMNGRRRYFTFVWYSA